MGVSGRLSKVSSVVAALCIFVYIVAIAFAIVQVIENIGERRSLAEKEFYDLTDKASSSAVFLGFMSEAYAETIKDLIRNSETLLAAIITGSDGEYAFERENGSGILWAGNSPRFKSGPGFPEKRTVKAELLKTDFTLFAMKFCLSKINNNRTIFIHAFQPPVLICTKN